MLEKWLLITHELPGKNSRKYQDGCWYLLHSGTPPMGMPYLNWQMGENKILAWSWRTRAPDALVSLEERTDAT